MWIFLNDAFFSIVREEKGRRKTLLVRARAKGDIEKVWPFAEVFATPARDYAFRARIPEAEVARAMTERILGIGYSNFKSGVHEVDRHDAYLRVWSAMYGFQAGRGTRRMGSSPWGRAEEEDLLVPLPFHETLEAEPPRGRRGCDNPGRRTPRRKR